MDSSQNVIYSFAFSQGHGKVFWGAPKSYCHLLRAICYKNCKSVKHFFIFSKLNNQISVKFSLVSILRIDYVKVKLGRI